MLSMESHQESREHRGTWPAPGLPKTLPWDVETPAPWAAADGSINASCPTQVPLSDPTPGNPRMGQAGREHRAHLLRPPHSGRAMPEHRDVPRHFWNISREGDSTASLHNLLQCLGTAQDRNSSSCSGGASWASVSSLCPLLLGTTKQSLVHPPTL